MKQQQQEAVTSAQAALAAAKQPNSAQDLQQQQDAVKSAQAALSTAQQPNTPQDIQQQQDAVTILTKAFFTPFVQTAPSTMPKGTVFQQNPPGGANAPLGTTVTIFVSNGQVPKSVVRTTCARGLCPGSAG